MGQGLSCSRSRDEHDFFSAVHAGDLATVESHVRSEARILHKTTIFDRFSALHIAAANGRVEVLSLILDQSVHPDLLNRSKQTPLMLAAMRGNIACVQKLLDVGANVLMFDSLHGRTCLHYAACYGQPDCLQAILSAARSTAVADSWGYARFVNIRDGNGATPLHLAARQRRPECVHILLDNGAIVSALTGRYDCAGSTPLHLAAHGGSLDCVRELLSWGADRLRRDSSGRIPYIVALKRKHVACAALLNPSSPEHLVWPSPLKFISELNSETKALLEAALTYTNREREKDILKGTTNSLPCPGHSDNGLDVDIFEDSDAELCCICFEQVCTIEIQDCGHEMCAHCTLALCCHNKPNPVTLCLPAPVCPFCRSSIAGLVVSKTQTTEGNDKGSTSKRRKSRRPCILNEGSSSIKGLSSAMGSLGLIRGSGRILDNCEMVDKP